MFKARVSKPCTHCGVMIEEGSTSGFTWDRTKSGFIHSQCIVDRRLAPKPVAVSVETVPNGNGNGNGHSKESALISALQALIVSPQINESEIRRIAADEAAKVTNNTTQLRIRVNEMPEIKIDQAHYMLPKLLQLVSVHKPDGTRPNIYLYGPAGSGKSTAPRQIAEILGLPFDYACFNPMVPDSKLMGYMAAGGEYIQTLFKERYENGGVFMFDEADNMSALLQASINGAIGNGHGSFPHKNVKRHQDFICIATGNTLGLGPTAQFPERRPMDPSFRDRFTVLGWGYDDKLTASIVGGILQKDPSEFIAWVKSVAEPLVTRHPTCIVSPRAYINAAQWEKAGLSRDEIYDIEIAKGLK